MRKRNSSFKPIVPNTASPAAKQCVEPSGCFFSQKNRRCALPPKAPHLLSQHFTASEDGMKSFPIIPSRTQKSRFCEQGLDFLNHRNYNTFRGSKSEVNSMTSKMGRPKAVNPKSFQLSVKMDAETLKKLDTLAERDGESRASIVRKGIERLYAENEK
jgi:hypothetical protein